MIPRPYAGRRDRRLFRFLLLAAVFLSAAAGAFAQSADRPNEAQILGGEAFYMDAALERVTVPEGIRVIGPDAFKGCTRLREITLPDSLEWIDPSAFQDCGALLLIRVHADTWACQWALESGCTVTDRDTGGPLTPFSRDGALADVPAAGDAEQIVLVSHLGGSLARLSVHEKRYGMWHCLWETDAFVGRNGVGKTREGDKRTPSGTFHLTCPFGILEDPGARMPYLQVTKYHYWCATSGDPMYNRLVDTRETARPRTPADEYLILYRPQYNYCMFIDYNAEGVPGKGSCIFLHCKGSAGCTAGCVAADQDRVRDIIRWAQPGALIVIR